MQYPEIRGTGRFLGGSRGPGGPDRDDGPDADGGPGPDSGPGPDDGVYQVSGAGPDPADGGSRPRLARERTAVAAAELARFQDLLVRAAHPGPAVDFDSQRRSYEPRPYTGPHLGGPPRWEDFAPPQPAAGPDEGPGRQLLNPAYQRELAQAKLRHQRALREWREQQDLLGGPAGNPDQDRIEHERAELGRARAVEEYNATLDECRRAYREGEPAAVESLLERALAAAEHATPDLPASCRATFRPLTRTAVLDLELPSPDVVPSVVGYRPAPDGDGVEPVPLPTGDRATHYLQLAALLALRALHAVVAADNDEVLAGAVLNGTVADPATGRGICLLTVEADRDRLARTALLPAAGTGPGAAQPAPGDPEDALTVLRALRCTVTPDPCTLVAVPPYAVATATAPAPEDLSPLEFGGLVRELLGRMGLADWSLRLQGRDGLVAVADGGPGGLLRGRWVVWAARRPEPVDADAVRTLQEAVSEEEADSGLWLSTGDFTPEAHYLDAADDTLLLIDGHRLRELLRVHLGRELGGAG